MPPQKIDFTSICVDEEGSGSYARHKARLRSQPWWSTNSVELHTKHKYEILQYVHDGSFAFRVFFKSFSFWLHQDPEEPAKWAIYIHRTQKSKYEYLQYQVNDWVLSQHYNVWWNEDLRMFTTGVKELPYDVLETIEVFNMLVNRSKTGFDNDETSRIISGDAPFEFAEGEQA